MRGMSAPSDGNGLRTVRLAGRAEALLAEVRSLPPWERARLERTGVSESDVAALCTLARLIAAAQPRP
jgi:hypothetical protein